MKKICAAIAIFLFSSPAFAATNVPFTIAMSEAVNVTGSPRIAVDVGGVTRYATYASGTGTSSLTFTYAAQTGDVDLDGVTISSPIDLNGGTITDLNGNPETDLTFTVPNTSGIKIDYPSLSMDFIADADGRYTLNGTAYNDLPAFLSATGGTFARNSVGTYFDSAGVLQTASANQPRFDHDPVTHTPKGILIEQSRTNLLLYSEDISNAIWDKNVCGGVTDSGSTTLTPKGTLVPIYDFTNNACVYQDVTIPSGTEVSQSIWIKANKTATIGFRIPGTASPTSISITVGTTWQRYSASAISDGTFSRLLIDNRAFNGYGVNGLQLAFFGGQVELGSNVSSYIPTTTAAVTRASDFLEIPTGGWFNALTGALYADSTHGTYFNSTHAIATLNDSANAASQRITLIRTSLNSIEGLTNNTTTQFQTAVSGNGNGGFNKSSLGYQQDNFRMCVNGTLSAADNSGSVPSVNRLGIGHWNGNNHHYNGWISNFKYYPLRISDTQLQLLTQ